MQYFLAWSPENLRQNSNCGVGFKYATFSKQIFSKHAQFATNFQKMLEKKSYFFKVLTYLTAEWQNCAQKWKSTSQTKNYPIKVYSRMIFLQNFPTISKFSPTIPPISIAYFSTHKLHIKHIPENLKYFMTLFFKASTSYYFSK